MIRVMLVDDEEDALDLLNILLGQIEGVEVAGRFTDPKRAIDALTSNPVDAVFLDNQMPGMAGTEAARRMRHACPDIPIVFTTAYAEYAVEAFDIQSTDYLLKPIALNKLKRAVSRIGQSLVARQEKTDRPAAAQPYIRAMGGFYLEMKRGEPGVLPWKTNKEKELCALLYHHGGMPVDAAHIIESIWPDSRLDRARTYLYTCMSYLRKGLRTHGIPASIDKTGSGFALLSDHLVSDASELEAALKQASESELPDDRLYARIVELYRGDYMEGCDYRWALTKQEALKQRYIRALRGFHGQFRDRGDAELAADSLQRVLDVAPDAEADGRALIKLHLARGDRGEALRVYRQLEQAIRRQLGVELEEETLRLESRLTGGE